MLTGLFTQGPGRPAEQTGHADALQHRGLVLEEQQSQRGTPVMAAWCLPRMGDFMAASTIPTRSCRLLGS